MNRLRCELLLIRIKLLKCALYYGMQNQAVNKKRKRKRVWTKKFILRREQLGNNTLLRELAVEEPDDYKNILRIPVDMVDELLQLVSPIIQRQDTNMRNAFPARLKLEVTLRYLAGGETLKFLSRIFRVGVSSISIFLPEVLEAIKQVLSPYLQVPKRAQEWKQIARRFNTQWNFPRCCGALDGKHIPIKKPPGSGAGFFNYKHFYSIVLLALVDADYKFLYVNIGASGRSGDAGVFEDCKLSAALQNNFLDLPPDHVILGDDAFPLKTYLMKRYPINTRVIKEKVFNYRLSRARNKVENAFGILANRFRFLLRPVEIHPETVEKAVWVACTIHNWLCKKSRHTYIMPEDVDYERLGSDEVIPGLWRSNTTTLLTSVGRIGSNNYTREAEEIRETFANYFCSDGIVPWQWKVIGLPDDYGYEGSDEDDDV